MYRRNFVQATLGGLLVSVAGPSLAAGFDAKSCFMPSPSAKGTVTWKAKKPPYHIAISNSYIGNTWRTEMMKIAKAFSQKPDIKSHIKQFQAASSGNDVSAQIAQMNQMILAGVDAIVVDAASPTGLNSVIDQAVSSGILVVSFDNVVTTKKAVLVNENQYEMGKRRAEFVVKQMGGKGHVLLVRGVAGTFVDSEHARAAHHVLSKHPNMNVTEVIGNWDDGTAQKVTANALATTPNIDGVICGGGDTGVVRAFLQAGRKMVPIAGEAENGFRKLAAKHKFPMMSIGNSPAEVAVSMRVAIEALQGKTVPQSIDIPLPIATTSDLVAGKNYFPDKPDNFFTDFNIAQCGVEFTLDEIMAQKV